MLVALKCCLFLSAALLRNAQREIKCGWRYVLFMLQFSSKYEKYKLDYKVVTLVVFFDNVMINRCFDSKQYYLFILRFL